MYDRCIFIKCSFDTYKDAMIINLVILFVFFCAFEAINLFFQPMFFFFFIIYNCKTSKSTNIQHFMTPMLNACSMRACSMCAWVRSRKRYFKHFGWSTKTGHCQLNLFVTPSTLSANGKLTYSVHWWNRSWAFFATFCNSNHLEQYFHVWKKHVKTIVLCSSFNPQQYFV